MDAILKVIEDSGDLDLSHYKRSSIERSISRRASGAGARTLSEYASLLRSDPGELRELLSDITVDFSFFFRDEKLFEMLKHSILPEVIRTNKACGQSCIRVWCAGCGAGEEAYSITILLFEAFKGNTGRDKLAIFATDVDPASLAKSHAGVYSAESIKNVPRSTRERYFSFEGHYRIKDFIKDLICFGKHDILSDPPISRIDLLLCRNVLMYLDKEGQSEALRRLRYAVRPGGFLVLGKSESLSRETQDSFAVVNRGFKIFRRKDEEKWPFFYQ